MTDSDHALEAIEHAATRLIPELTERLRRHGLGEIEVTDGGLRLRVAGAGAEAQAADAGAAQAASKGPSPSAAAPAAASGGQIASVLSDPEPVAVASPAVGFFVYADGLGPGLAVAKGDALGHVEMLGVRHDVRAPRGGTVRNLVAESGEAVEYGQTVVELETAEAGR